MVKIDGFAEVDKVLRELPNNISRSAKVAAGRKAARPIVSKARENLKSTLTKTKGNLDGFEHLRALSKLTKTTVYKGTVNVQVSGPDLPMGPRNWDAYSVARLFAFGRKTDKGTGTTKGFGDWINEAFILKRGTVLREYAKGMETALKKAVDKTAGRYGKQY